MKRLNKRGSISFFMAYVWLAIVLLVLFAAVIPLLQTMNTAMYAQAETILLDGNATAAKIQTVSVRDSLQAGFQAQVDSIETQNDILSVFFQYGWLIMILAIVMVMFMLTRETVELGVR